MTPDEIQDLLYEISSMLILLCIFYIILTLIGLIRLKSLLLLDKKYLTSIFLYGGLLLLCIFRFITCIYGIFDTLSIKSSDDFGHSQQNIFLALFPDCLFWSGIFCYLWLVFNLFYNSHLNEKEFFIINNDSSRIRLFKNNWKCFIFILATYESFQFFAFPLIYFFAKLSYLDYATIQGSFALLIPFISAYFMCRMFKKLSGTFYISNELKKLSRTHVKQMMIVLGLRFVVGLVDLILFQTNFKILKIENDQAWGTIDYNEVIIDMCLALVSLFFLEIGPIYLVFQKNTLKICEIYNFSDLLLEKNGGDEAIIAKTESIIIKEINDRNNETVFVKSMNDPSQRNKLSQEELKFPEKFLCNIKKFEYEKLKFKEFGVGRNINNSFGNVQYATLSSEEILGFPEFCVRTIELSTKNRYLLEDVEKDMNKHIFLQVKTFNKIVYLEGYALNERSICLIYENMKNGSLSSFLSSSQKESLSFDFRVKILSDLAESLKELHSLNIIHGHITPNNIFFDIEFNVKIGDFLFYDLKKYTGYSKGYSNKSKYTAPEYFKDNNFIVIAPRPSADVYSFAIIAWEVLTSEEAFSGVKKKDLNKILNEQNARPKIPENKIPEELANLIRCCWQQEESNRPNFTQIIGVLKKFSSVSDSHFK